MCLVSNRGAAYFKALKGIDLLNAEHKLPKLNYCKTFGCSFENLLRFMSHSGQINLCHVSLFFQASKQANFCS